MPHTLASLTLCPSSSSHTSQVRHPKGLPLQVVAYNACVKDMPHTLVSHTLFAFILFPHLSGTTPSRAPATTHVSRTCPTPLLPPPLLPFILFPHLSGSIPSRAPAATCVSRTCPTPLSPSLFLPSSFSHTSQVRHSEGFPLQRMCQGHALWLEAQRGSNRARDRHF